MTRKLFWEDSYLTQAVTQVTHVEGENLRVASTVFFAFSGGQESDSGTIGGFRVVEEARKEGLDIIYRLPPGHGLKIGDEVEIAIDWQRRYRPMRLHFAAEDDSPARVPAGAWNRESRGPYLRGQGADRFRPRRQPGVPVAAVADRC
jgi:hypothetical protein